jgi:tetratricopeptide (TPR) repeat protein
MKGAISVILNDYTNAEKSFKKAIELNSKDSYSWCELGNIYHFDLHNYKESEKYYKQAISINGNVANYWYFLGELYKNNLFEFEEAEKAFNKAIMLNVKDENSLNALGNLYQDNLIDYKKAERTYKKALAINEKALSPKINLIFLYRDKLNRISEAEELFNSIESENDTNDSYWLNKTSFDLYKRNEGNANESILNALSKIETTIPDSTQDDWWRFGAIVTKLGYGNWLLTVLEEKGFDIILSPYYVALKAMNVKDAEGYLNSKAVEIRDPAIKLIEIMKNYM